MQVLGSLHWAGVEQFLTLPLSDLFEGRIVQVEGVLYTYNSGAWRSPPGILPGIDVTTTGFFLSNDGVNAVWQASPSGVPPVDGTTIGKYLTNDGVDSMWDVVLRAGIQLTGASHVLINDPTGAMSSEVRLHPSRGGLGADGSAFTGILRATAGVFTAGTVANADLDPGIDAVKIADGTVTNAEFQFINTLSSNAQTQLDARLLLAGGTLTGPLLLAADPLTALGAATKQYVDSVGAGLEPKSAARAATTADITLSGAQTIDGVSIIAGNRVLVKDQTLQENNGLYLCAAGAWTRTTDMDSWLEVPGAYVFIQEGTLNIGSSWVCSSPVGGNMGVTAITWVQFSGGANITTDGQGIEISGSQLSLELDGATLSKSGTGIKVAALGITNAEISASAGIVDTKLATIATAGKVSNSATTATNLNTASAIVARDGSGNFEINDITAFKGTLREFPLASTAFDLAPTGATTFAGFTITGGGTTFTVGAGTGFVVDHTTNEYIPVSWGAFTGQLPLTANGITHVYITRLGAIVTTLTLPDGVVRRDNIVLGRAGTVAGTIISTATTTVSAIGIGNTLVDTMEALAAFRISGIIMSPNGANMNVNRSSGSIFRSGVNFVADPKNPNVRAVTSATAVTLMYTTSSTFNGNSAVVIPTNYESAPGVVTAYAGSGNQATIQRVYQYPGAGLTTAVQYGSVIYSDLSAAVQAIGTETYTPNPSHADNAVLVAIICVTKGCTDLSNSATARIFIASRFGESSVGAAGVSVSTFQNVYTNSTVPQLLTDSTRGALTIRRGSAADTDQVLTIQNGAGSTTASITGAGVITGSSFPSPLIPDFLRFTETTAPATPSAGTLEVFAKSDHKLYTKDSNGLESLIGSGSGSGVKNYISSPNDSGNWTSSNIAQLTVTTESNATLIPFNVSQLTGIKITRISGAAYAYIRWTVDSADYNWNCALLWAQKYAGTAGDYTVSLWTNTLPNGAGSYTQVPLPTSSIPSATTNFGPIAGLSGGSGTQYMELRINGIAGTTPLYLNGVTYTPNPPGQGAAVGDWVSYTPAISAGLGGQSGGEFWYKRDASDMLIKGNVLFTSTSATVLTVSIPTGLTVNNSLIQSANRGMVGRFIIGTGAALISSTDKEGTLFCDDSDTSNMFFAVSLTATGLVKSAGNQLIATASGWMSIDVRIPIAEWAGSGLNMGAGAQVEYGFNSSTATAANDTTSFGYGPQGAQIQNITATLDRTVRFQYPIQPTDMLVLEVSSNRIIWRPVEQYMILGSGTVSPYAFQNTTAYGCSIINVSGTNDVIVRFGTYASPTGATYTAAGEAWSVGSGACFWRVRKANPSSPVGFGLAGVDGSAGLYMAGRAPGSVSGAVIPAGYLGEMPGATVRTGTNGNAYSIRSTTTFGTSFTTVVTDTLNKGTYLVSCTCSVVQNSTAQPIVAALHIGGTLISITPFQDVASSGRATISLPAYPIIITTDGTAVDFKMQNFNSGVVSTASNEMTVVRIA